MISFQYREIHFENSISAQRAYLGDNIGLGNVAKVP